MKIPETSPETFQKLTDFGKALGKTTVECKVNHQTSDFGYDAL